MANEQNLMSAEELNSRRTPEQHSEDSAKGGRRSGETRRLQGAIRRALEAKATSAEFKELFDNFGIDKESRDYATAIGCVVIQKAVKGDLSAMSFIRDTIGEKPKEEISLDGGVVIVDDLAGKT